MKMSFFFKNILNIFAQSIYCGYEYPQSMFWSKNKKNRYTPENPSFSILSVYNMEFKPGYTFHGHVFLMEKERL